jgi:hypothetical protein
VALGLKGSAGRVEKETEGGEQRKEETDRVGGGGVGRGEILRQEMEMQVRVRRARE